ncbi:hypothetical protein EKD04_023665 [Chloroflexales bacterium ZM16-3]|nr:hypothetical protein [Chloroflexales bacterium ZM16-3]
MLSGDDPISARWLGIIATYGPTLAAMALAGLLRPESQAAVWPRRRLWRAGGALAGTACLNLMIASNAERRPATELRALASGDDQRRRFTSSTS